MGKSNAPLRIGIVGAGISGLVTGVLLRELGHQVEVFEARDRPGGRIHTIEFPPNSGILVEAGAARISDMHAHTFYWIERMGLDVEPAYPYSGQMVRLEQGERLVGRDFWDLSAHDIHHFVTGHADWSSQFDGRVKLLARPFRNALLKPNWYRVTDGMAALARALAGQLGPSLHLEMPITTIDCAEERIRLSASQSFNGISGLFDKVVLAVPAATLPDIAMIVPLSSKKLSALSQLTTQPSLRFFFFVREPMWTQCGESGWGCTDDGIEIWCSSSRQYGIGGVVVLYVQGDPARAFLELGDRQREEKARRIIERAFPQIASSIDVTASYCWNEDPWARGAQSKNRGNTPALECPEGNLHFAGEYTGAGWIDGTIKSAYRVVGEIAGLN